MSIEEKRTRMLKILQETVEFYSEDTSRRAVDGVNPCMSKPVCRYRLSCGDAVKKCALGRYIRDEMYNRNMEGRSAHGVHAWCNAHDTTFDDILVPQAQGLSLSFWTNLQFLHDRESHWGEKGISKGGRALVDALARAITKGTHD